MMRRSVGITQAGKKAERVVLAHGWLGHPRQFRALGRALTTAGFEVSYVRHYTLFGRFESAVEAALRCVGEDRDRPTHLIGFSLGGLVLRAVAANPPQNIASLLLIGVPNAGSSLADLLRWVFPTPSIRRLSPSAPRLPEPQAGIRVGCIAGDRGGLLGLLLAGRNDSRVTVESAFAVRHEFARIVSRTHWALHRSPETHRHAVAFLSEKGG